MAGTPDRTVEADIALGDVTLSVSDLEIGAVEIKDGASDTRAKVAAANSIAENDNAIAVRDAGNSKGAGTVDAATQRVVLASDGPTVSALGTVSDAEATGNGSIIAILKRIRTVLTPSTAVTVTTSAVVTGSAGAYRGFSLRETSGTATATVRLYNNASAASGVIIETIQLNPGESRSENLPVGVAVVGIYFSLVSGAVEGSVRHG